MSKIAYINKRFNKSSWYLIDVANSIIEEYDVQDLQLTVRQLYYRIVATDRFPDDRKYSRIAGTDKWRKDPEGTTNATPNYKWLIGVLTDARMAGLVDWSAIIDRTRNLKRNYHNTDPGQAVEDALDHFRLNMWETQPSRVEVWIEKEALIGVIEDPCKELDVPYFTCKGYPSVSSLWRTAQRYIYAYDDPDEVTVIYMGDHDPSGIDITRNIEEQLTLFTQGRLYVHVVRAALNMDQIRQYNPPPNPVKFSDSRAPDYVANFGRESWELDALDPATLQHLIETEVETCKDLEAWQERLELEQEYRDTLQRVVDHWEDL